MSARRPGNTMFRLPYSFAIGAPAALALVLAAACDPSAPGTEEGGGPPSGPNGAGCPDDLAFFKDNVWTPILSQKCIVCHTAGGLAGKTRMKLIQPAGSDLSEEEVLQKNFETARDVARIEEHGGSILLLRPTGKHPDGHAGGKIIALGSPEDQALSAFVDRVTLGKGCGAEVASCAEVEPGRRMLRRLSRDEYDRTITDLFGFPSAWGAAFVADTVVNGFDNHAASLTVSPLLADQLQKAAEEISALAVKNGTLAVPCDPAIEGISACGATWIGAFGKRVFRRPLTAAERAPYEALFTTVATEDGFDAGLGIIVTAMLQSPHFLYRTELGAPDAAAKDDKIALTPYEVASELSYFFWGTMPDDALFSAAEAGKLATPDQVEIEARRLLDDPRADRVLDHFLEAWLQTNGVVNKPKDEATYPGFDDGLRSAMREETRRLFREVVRSPEGTVKDLLLADHTKVAPALAALYGEDGGTPDAEGLVSIDVTSSHRLGILGHGAVLATQAGPSGSSPIHRGKLVRERLFCQKLPPPPAGLNVQPPPVDPTKTTRERFLSHATVEPCTGCHQLIDPIGFGFEHFDGIGRYRDMESGKPIDSTGEIVSTPATNKDFDGLPALAGILAESPDVHACFSLQTFRFAYGIEEDAGTVCLANEVANTFSAEGLHVSELLVALTQTRHFLERKADVDAVPEDPTGTGGAGGAGGSSASGTGGADAPDPPANVEITFQKDSMWQAGYCATVLVKNAGSAEITWTVTMDVEGTITDLWNASKTEVGAETVFVGLPYNAALDPGEQTSFGFCAGL